MISELELDLAEIKSFLSQSNRNAVKSALTELQARVQTKLDQAKFKESAAAVPSKPVSAGILRPFSKISTYAFDESDKFVKLYYTIHGIQNVPAENVTSSFTADSFEVCVNDVAGKDFGINVKGLTHPIDPSQSTIKQKNDTLLVMLRKTSAVNWGVLLKMVSQKKKDEQSMDMPDGGGDPQASLMNMMKKMYDEGDDEMKRSLRKAWHDSQSKKASGDFAGAPDFGPDM